MNAWYIASLICAAIGVLLMVLGVRSSEKGGADAWGAEIIGFFAGVVVIAVGVALALIGLAVS